MEPIAVDLGFSYIKVFSDIATFKIPSIVGEGISRTFDGFTKNKTPNDRLKNLHTKIDDKEWFIGELAIRQESGMFVYDENRLNNEETKAALLSLLAMINDTHSNYFTYTLFTGLPISHYKNKDLRKSYKENLLGSHYVTLLDQKEPINRKITIENVEVYPQGIGAYFNMVLDSNGSVRSDYKPGNYAVIDQGYRTLDFVVFNQEFEMIERKSGTKEKGLGIKDLLNELLEKLQHQFKEEAYDLNELDMLSALENKFIVLGGKKIELGIQIEQLYQKQANKIIKALAPLWGKFNFDTIYLAGGIATQIEQYLKVQLKSTNLVVARGEFDSQFANAEGFFKYGKKTLMSAIKE